MLAEHGEEAKPLAGGQSLIPLLNFRLARPAILVDLARVPELQGMRRGDDRLVVGATVRQREIERSDVVRSALPLVPEAVRHVGHVQIRNRGTVGGSLAHADPAAELPAVAIALDATLVAQSRRGERVVPAEAFFLGPFTTVLEPDELLTEVRLPLAAGDRTGFLEFARRSGDFALGGVAARVRINGGGPAAAGTGRVSEARVSEARLVGLGVGSAPVRLAGGEAALVGSAFDAATIDAAAAAASAEVSPPSDIHADAEYRAHLLGVLVRRVLHRIAGSPPA